MAKKSSGACKWLYLVFPIAIACLFVFMAFTAYSVTDPIFGITASANMYNYLLNENILLAAGVSTLVIDIIVAVYFLVIPFVGEKTSKKLNFVTVLMLIAAAVANLVLSIYVSVKLGWKSIAFFGAATYILWYAIAGFALIFAVCKAYKAFKD